MVKIKRVRKFFFYLAGLFIPLYFYGLFNYGDLDWCETQKAYATEPEIYSYLRYLIPLFFYSLHRTAIFLVKDIIPYQKHRSLLLNAIIWWSLIIVLSMIAIPNHTMNCP